MTPIVLLEQLKGFLETATADLPLPTEVDPAGGARRIRAPKVFLMWLPDKAAEEKECPYLLLQYLKGEDTQDAGQPVQSQCMVRIICMVYGEDGQAGGMDLLNLMTRVRVALLAAGEVGGQFALRPPLESIIYANDTYPYYMGEMMTTWDIPAVKIASVP